MAATHLSNWASNAFTKALHIQYPIIQAPCAGHTGADLIAAVSNAGGLGSLGAGMLPATQLRSTIRSIRSKTNKPFAVNLFCRPSNPATEADLQKHYAKTDDELNKIRTELHIPIPEKYELRSPPFDEQINVLLEECVPVVSFTFGFLPDTAFKKLKSAGTYLIGTATTVNEALVLAGLDPSDPTRKADAIVAQGVEAGGHRGSFLPGDQLPVSELVAAIRQTGFPIPILAAGGFSTGDDVFKGLNEYKADGVAIGTLFMLATESDTPKAHREYLLNAEKNNVEPTKITTAITGRKARAYPNQLLKRIEALDADIPSYDIHSSKTKDIATYATKNGISDYMLLLSGANASKAVEYSEQGTLSAAQIVNKIVSDVNQRYK